jgi:hypothetical protein
MPSHIVFMCCNYQQPEPARIKSILLFFLWKRGFITLYTVVGGGAGGVRWGGGKQLHVIAISVYTDKDGFSFLQGSVIVQKVYLDFSFSHRSFEPHSPPPSLAPRSSPPPKKNLSGLKWKRKQSFFLKLNGGQVFFSLIRNLQGKWYV